MQTAARLTDLLSSIVAECDELAAPESGEAVVIDVRGNARHAIVEVNGWAQTSKNGISTMMSSDEADDMVLALLERYPAATLADRRVR